MKTKAILLALTVFLSFPVFAGQEMTMKRQEPTMKGIPMMKMEPAMKKRPVMTASKNKRKSIKKKAKRSNYRRKS